MKRESARARTAKVSVALETLDAVMFDGRLAKLILK